MSTTGTDDRSVHAPVVVNIPQQVQRPSTDTQRRRIRRPAWLTEPPTIIAALLVLLVIELVAYEAIGPWWLLMANVVLGAAIFGAAIVWRRKGGASFMDWLTGRRNTPRGQGHTGRGHKSSGGHPGSRRSGHGPLRGLLDRLTQSGQRRRATATPDGRGHPGTTGRPSGGRVGGRSPRWPFGTGRRRPPDTGHGPASGHGPAGSGGQRRPWWKPRARSATKKPAIPGVPGDPGHTGPAKKPAGGAKPIMTTRKPSAPGATPSTPTKGTAGGNPMTIHRDDASLFRWGEMLQRIPTVIEEQVAVGRSQSDQLGGVAATLSAFAQQGVDDQPASRALASEVEGVAKRFAAAQERIDEALAEMARCQADAEGLSAMYRSHHETDLARRDGERGPRHVEQRADVSRADDV